jgi:hypothetical protein
MAKDPDAEGGDAGEEEGESHVHHQTDGKDDERHDVVSGEGAGRR